MQTISLVAVLSLAESALWTLNDPFVGKWRLDVSRSAIIDEMRVETLDAQTYRFNFEGAAAETVIADGTDQPGVQGTTLSVKGIDARSLMVVRKQDGHIIVSAMWKLSPDGSILHDAFTGVQPDGSEVSVDYYYKRVSGGSGFGGVWESTTKPHALKLELEIKPHDQGLSFVSPGSEKSVTFDGREHAVAGKDGVTLSGQRRDTHAMEYTEKNRGKVERVRQFTLSSDGRTLTETVRTEATAPDVLVFERE